jgi:hypothetical protein
LKRRVKGIEMVAKRIFVCLLLLVALSAICFTQTTHAAPKSQRIKIYFYHEPGEYIDLSPVTRVIRSNAPARAAIKGYWLVQLPRNVKTDSTA